MCFDIRINIEIQWNLSTVIFWIVLLCLCRLTAVKLHSNCIKMCTFRTFSPATLILFFSLLICLSTHTKCDDVKRTIRSVHATKSKAWGPGLTPDKIVLPVRFFYIQAFDAYGYP